MSVKCPECLHENPDDTVYCRKCAARLKSSEKVSVTKTLEAIARGSEIGRIVAGKYKIIEKLGEGGMGVVYRAEDIKLKRSVAIKFLTPALTADAEAKERFIKEAQAASALEHNNICTVHEIDEAEDEQLFIAMSYYEGETLKEKIQRERLKLEKVLEFAVQIAQGLAKAHNKGIIHRDIKPTNIMVTEEGVVKIVDFGLAKLSGETRVTKTGTAKGTVAYMSPEQARGEDTDHRTDIWSLGVTLYEMLTGQLPFKGEKEQSVLYSILNKEPEPVSSLITGIPVELENIVIKALHKDFKERYQSFDEFLLDMQEVYKRMNIKPVWRVSFRSRLRRRKWIGSPVLWVSVFVIIGAVIGFLLFYPASSIPFQERDWILITDFKNLTGDEIFDRSLNTALTVNLQQSRHINVFPRVRVKDTLQRMGREAVETLDDELGSEVAVREGIKALVSCSIDQVGDVYSLSANIIDPNAKVALKSEAAQATGKDGVLNALDDLAGKIRKDLGESLKDIREQSVSLPLATTSSLEALKYYAEAQSVLAIDRAEGVALLEKAIELDPDFALAHSELGVHHYTWTHDREKGEEHFQKALSLLGRLTEREKLWIQAEMAAVRGNREDAVIKYKVYLRKYPDDSGGWFRLGHNYLMLHHWDDAVAAFVKVHKINPHEAVSYINIATCYSASGRYQQAIDHYLKAFELRPEFLTFWNINSEFGFTYVKMGEMQKAQEVFEKMFTEDDGKKASAHRYLALLYMYQGRFLEAIDHLKESILLNKTLKVGLSELRDRLYLASVYRTKGMMDAFKGELRAVDEIRSKTYIAPWWLLLIGKMYARLGNLKEASHLLEEISNKMNEEKKEDRAVFNILKGEIELVKGNHDEAVELFEMAYKLRSDNYPLESVAYGYLMKGDLEQAIAKYELMINDKDIGWEAQEYWIQAHYQLGKIYEEKGDVEKAIQYYEDFLDIWNEADSDIPLLMDARKRLAELQNQ